MIFAGFVYLLQYFLLSVTADDQYIERLFLKPLPNNQLFSYFEFLTQSDKNYDSISDLFPQILHEIYVEYDVLELHLSLTSGTWNYNNWGLPYRNAPGTGLELWIWFRSHLTESEINANWQFIRNRLSALICASISLIDQSHTISPEFTLRPISAIPKHLITNYTTGGRYLRYGQLPHEAVCTENLRPWKKLLPCSGLDQGLVSLLNSKNIYNSRFLSIELHLTEICLNTANKCTKTRIEQLQTASFVYDSIFVTDRNWSLRKLFGQGLMQSCPFAKNSTIIYDITSNYSTGGDYFKLSPDLYKVSTVVVDNEIRYWAEFEINRLMNQSKHNVFVKYFNTYPAKIDFVKQPILTFTHYRLGFSEENGQFVIRIRNNYWKNQRILLLATYLPFVQIYYHTLDIRLKNGTKLNPIMSKLSTGTIADAISLTKRKPSIFELVLDLPSTSTIYVTVDFEHIFLKWLQYPPDASHGFYLPSVILTAQLPLLNNQTKSVTRLVQLRSEVLLLLLPIPDFSMPYNVICLACTVIALGFGPIYNMTTKSFKIHTEPKLSLKERILNKLKALLKKEKVE